jgi:large subunit ribosomal protein L4
MKLDIYNKTGKKSTKKLTLSNSVFGIEPNEHSVYLAVNSELAALRQGTHSSKTRAEVSGGGTKPYKQKGTGRARVGSTRNPSRVHGSSAFGPKPHKYDKKINKKVRQLAHKSVLSKKVSSGKFIVVSDFIMDVPKTKDFIQVINNLNLDGEKVTVLADEVGDNLFLGSRNLRYVTVIPAKTASTFDMLDCQTLVVDVAGAESLNAQLAK